MIVDRLQGACTFLYLVCLYSNFCSAAGSEGDDFRQIYGEYQKYVEQKEWDKALNAAESALQYGVQIFDKQGANVANLRFNYAKLLNRFEKFEPATKQLKDALSAKEKIYGTSSEQLIEILLELGVASHHSKRASVSAKHLNRAATLAAKTSNATYEARVSFKAGMSLVNLGSSRKAKPLLARAQRIYHEKFGTADVRGAIASLQLGKIQLTEKNYKDSRRSLELAVLAFASPASGQTPGPLCDSSRKQETATLCEANRRFALSSRKLLVEVLERMDLRDDATAYCVEFAKLKADGGNARPEVLYQGHLRIYNPFDSSIGGPSGEVTIEFMVDEAGYVNNPQVVYSSEKKLNQWAIKSLQTRRYSPGISGGSPVETQGLFARYGLNQWLEVR